MKVNKATFEPYDVALFAPIIKENEGKYVAVLSDTSMDRDGEKVGESALRKIARSPGYIAGLLDHRNEVLNQVCQWKNIRLRKIGNDLAIVAEPKFFESNPKAVQIKGMLDEGAEMGISIGAIVKEVDEEDNGKSKKPTLIYTELELLEASFVAIPSNRHGRVLALAKSFTGKKDTITDDDNVVDGKIKEVKTMTEITQKDIDSAVEKAKNEYTEKLADAEKQLKSKSEEMEKLQESVNDVSKKLEVAEKAVDESKKAEEVAKKAAIDKQKIADDAASKNAMSDTDVDKAFKEGKLLFGRVE